MQDTDDRYEPGSELDYKDRVEPPRMYRVILHNDHYTTTDFVVEVLMQVFHMPEQTAKMVMLDVHKKGSGVCGVYSLDIAATKTAQVHEMARARQFPLKCSYEEA